MSKSTEHEMERQCSYVGTACNYYGGVAISNYEGKRFWGVEDHNGIDWEEIPEYLYAALLRFKMELKTK